MPRRVDAAMLFGIFLLTPVSFYVIRCFGWPARKAAAVAADPSSRAHGMETL